MSEEDKGRLAEDHGLNKEQLMDLARDLRARGKSVEGVAHILRVDETEARQLLIEWGYNCLTTGPHHGRPEKIWTMPLLQTTYMFSPAMLQELVVARIHTDAVQMVEHGAEPRLSMAWADRTKEIAAELVLPNYQRTVGAITNYYKSRSCRADIEAAIGYYKEYKLNPAYQPMHPHDSINMLCRMVGFPASRKAAGEVGR